MMRFTNDHQFALPNIFAPNWTVPTLSQQLGDKRWRTL